MGTNYYLIDGHAHIGKTTYEHGRCKFYWDMPRVKYAEIDKSIRSKLGVTNTYVVIDEYGSMITSSAFEELVSLCEQDTNNEGMDFS